MASILPEDANGNPIPALSLKTGGAHQVAIDNVTSTRNAAAFDSKTDVISVYSSENCYIKFGDNSVTATTGDHFLPAALYLDLAIGPNENAQNAYLAILSAEASGTVYISEKE